MTIDHNYIFVSYSHADEQRVLEDVHWLQGKGVNLKYDNDISAGKAWRTELANSILGAEKVFFFISKESTESLHCKREIEYAIDNSIEVIPILLDDSSLPPDLALYLNRIQALMRTDDDTYRAALLNTALNQAPTQAACDAVSDLRKRQLKAIWNELPDHWKVIVGSMIVMQSFSIASIADTVFEFKGFIVLGIELYKTITEPLIDFLVWLNLTFVDRLLFDSLVWAALFFGSIFRSVVVLDIFSRPHGDISSIQQKAYLLLGSALAYLSFEALFEVISSLLAGNSSGILDFTIVVLGLIGVVWAFDKTKFSFGPDWKKGFSLAVSFFSAPILLIAVVAGVSEGLAR